MSVLFRVAVTSRKLSGRSGSLDSITLQAVLNIPSGCITLTRDSRLLPVIRNILTIRKTSDSSYNTRGRAQGAALPSQALSD